jgi:hypothetical protein
VLWLLSPPVRPVGLYATPSSLPEILAVVVALLVGVIGPIVLWRNTGRTIAAEEVRQANALAAERDRLAATLEAEEKRHRDQLTFEREETDLSELRRILDALAEALFTIQNTVEQLTTMMMLDAEHPTDVRESSTAGHYDEAQKQLYVEERRVARHVERLRLRLGDEGSQLVKLATEIRDRAGTVRLASMGIAIDTAENVDVEVSDVKRLRGLFTEEAWRFTIARLDTPRQKSSV